MTYLDRYKDIFRVKTNRLPVWDYSSPGYYFVTICVKDRACVLGEIHNRKIYLSNMGQIVQESWNEIPKHFDNVRTDEFVIMPNHIHGIINIIHHVETCHGMSLQNEFHKPKRGSLGTVINHFKGSVTRSCNKKNINFHWQPRYYDHIIRDEQSLNTIREYIRYNPLKWDIDEENPLKL